MSREFTDFIRRLGEVQSKQEEERVLGAEKVKLKTRFLQTGLSVKELKESIIKAVYCEMLGDPAPFSHIHAVTLAQTAKNPLDKTTAYIAVALLLHPHHELAILLVHSFLRDISSSNPLDVSAALSALCRLVSAETIPPLINSVRNALSHPNEVIRKKAIMCFLRFYQLSPSSVQDSIEDLRKKLFDKDPCVIGATLCFFYELIKDNPSDYVEMTGTLVSLLKTICDGRLPRSYDYHGVPAPWHQIHILKILSFLGENNQKASEEMYQIILHALKKAETGIDASFAIIYECVKTITTIYPNPELLQTVANSLGRFLNSTNNNLKYLGIIALTSIVQVDPKYAAPYQLIVIDCLENADETLKRKTLGLLSKMTNVGNVGVIVEKMINYLRITVDEYLRLDLVGRITQLAEQFAPNNLWFLKTMTNVFELGGDLVNPEVGYNLLLMLAEGSDEEEADTDLRKQAVDLFVPILQKQGIPDILVQIALWIIGEYSYLSDKYRLEEQLLRVVDVLEGGMLGKEKGSKIGNRRSITNAMCLTAAKKLISQLGSFPGQARTVIEKYCRSGDVEVQQRAQEIIRLTQQPNWQLMEQVLPIDASAEQIQVDVTLSFTNSFVSQSLSKGAQPYNKQIFRSNSRDNSLSRSNSSELLKQNSTPIKFQAYQTPNLRPTSLPNVTLPKEEPNQKTDNPLQPTLTPEVPKGTDIKKKWGKQGFLDKPESPRQNLSSPKQLSNENLGGHSQLSSPSKQQHTPVKEPPQKEPTKYEREAKERESKIQSQKEQLAQSIFGDLSKQTPSPQAKGIRSQKQQQQQQRNISQPQSPQPQFQSQSQSQPQSPQPQMKEELLLDFSDITIEEKPTQTQFNLDLLQDLSLTSSPEFLPLTLNTQEFGQLWVQLQYEAKASLSSTHIFHLSISDVLEVLTEQLNFHRVNMIGTEGLASGTLSGADKIECLFHGKKEQNKTFSLTVRTKRKDLTDSLLQQIVSLF